jgi:hypothetical protein
MHLFYASPEIAVLVTSEAIRLVARIGLRTEGRTYPVTTLYPCPHAKVKYANLFKYKPARERKKF